MIRRNRRWRSKIRSWNSSSTVAHAQHVAVGDHVVHVAVRVAGAERMGRRHRPAPVQHLLPVRGVGTRRGLDQQAGVAGLTVRPRRRSSAASSRAAARRTRRACRTPRRAGPRTGRGSCRRTRSRGSASPRRRPPGAAASPTRRRAGRRRGSGPRRRHGSGRSTGRRRPDGSPGRWSKGIRSSLETQDMIR